MWKNELAVTVHISVLELTDILINLPQVRLMRNACQQSANETGLSVEIECGKNQLTRFMLTVLFVMSIKW